MTTLEAEAARNQQLVAALQTAKETILALKEEIDRLAQPPNGFGIFLGVVNESTIDIFSSGRKMRVSVAQELKTADLRPGQEVMLNEAGNAAAAFGYETVGVVVSLVSVLEDGLRAEVSSDTGSSQIVYLADSLDASLLKVGDHLMKSSKYDYAYEVIPKAEMDSVLLEEVPDITYDNIGGLDTQIETLRDAIELPYLHPDLFKEHKLRAPKGVLLYGPPGCGKTLAAKAVANSLAKKVAEAQGVDHVKSYFLNIKGPELLNKYVGETERQIREVFAKAREAASAGNPVVIFFDEMESLFRTRGSGVSSDMESTIVPQILAELDGVEGLENVVVIGASNREDLIDPALLRPGRLDVKIKVERPDAEAAKDIFAKYITPDLPMAKEALEACGGSAEACAQLLVQEAVSRMYAENEENKFLEVTYASGDRDVLYFKDFNSGAMIENIVSRAKKYSIKAYLETGEKGLKFEYFALACVEEFRENEDLPSTSSPDDWARISGLKGERIINVRTLISKKGEVAHGGKTLVDNVTNIGQYL